jgi:chromosome segregation ATPase
MELMIRIASRGSLALAAAITALAAAGCGGGNETMSTTDWADGVCSAITTWKDSITSATQQVRSGNLSKDALQSAASDLEDANKTLADDLRDLGRPDTESGQKVKDTVQQISDDVDESRDTISKAADSAKDVNSTLAAVSVVSDSLRSLLTKMNNAVTELSKVDAGGEIESAFAQADSCQTLRR